LHQKVPRRLTQYSSNYNRLSEDEITDLLALCILFSPEVLNNKVFFEDTSSNGSTNRFLELSSVKSSMLVAENMVIGGENRRVAKIMTCTQAWLRNNYHEPMRRVLSHQIGGYQGSSTQPALTAPSRPYYGNYNPNTRPGLAAPSRPHYGTYDPIITSRNNSGCCCCIIL
jgi:hypothetical protein